MRRPPRAAPGAEAGGRKIRTLRTSAKQQEKADWRQMIVEARAAIPDRGTQGQTTPDAAKRGRREGADSNAVGMGDHVPAFLMREVRTKATKS